MPNAGWPVSRIINQVQGRTENRTANKPNFDILMEFFLGLDEFCQEKHYWWRRKAASFQTVVDQQTYDLSATNGTSTAAIAADAIEIEEAFVVNANPLCGPCRVHPNFTPRDQIAAMFGPAAIGGCIPHTGYFLAPGGFQQWEFTMPPQEIYTVGFTYYACPMVQDTGTANVPLVPPNLHWGLVYMLERRVYEMLYGENDPRFVMANARYQQFVLSAARSKQFSSQEAIHSQAQIHAVSASGRGHRRGGRY